MVFDYYYRLSKRRQAIYRRSDTVAEVPVNAAPVLRPGITVRTFLRTLLHEYCHHLDYERLGLAESFHTEGFFKRELSLFRQLVESEQEKKGQS